MTEMKDSGVAWINTIPKEWKLKKIKYALKNRNENNNPIRSKNILSLTAKQGVIPLEEKEGGGNKPKEDYSAYKLAYPNDIVMNSMNVLSGSVGLSKYFGCVSPVYYMLRPIDEKDDVRYYNYIFQTTVFQRSLLGLGNGILMKESDNGKLNTIRMRIPLDKLGNLLIPVPDSSIQRKIADYLDSIIPNIDMLLADIEKQIETLEEYKKTIITEAVTKGLDPDVEMKDSGIEWIGMIPKNWNISRLKYELETSMKYGASEAGVEYSDDLPRYIRITDITNNNRLKTGGKLSLTEKQANGYMLEKDTVLFARSGGTVGKTFLYKPEYGKAAFAGYLISAIPDKEKMQAEWLYYFSLSNAYWDWANQIFTQATIQNIGADKYSNLPIPIPSIDIQNAIVNYLNKKCAEIDDIITDKKKQLETLEQYKKSLIYEYVTGKKEVQ